MLSLAVNAQELFLGGSIYANLDRGETTVGSTTNEDDKTNTLGLNPKFGIFLTEDIAFGAGVNFNRQKTIDAEDSDDFSVNNSFSFNPFARYYVINGGDFKVFAEGGLGFGLSRSKVESGGQSNDGPEGSSFEIYLMPAISYALTESFILEASVGSVSFDRNKTTTTTFVGAEEVEQEDINSDFGFNFGISSINFGAIFILP
jgi:opacity protein-like surface antigen